MIKMTDFLSEDLFTSNLKMKPHEKLIVKAVVEFMRKKYGFASKVIVKKKDNIKLFGDVILNDTTLNKDKFYLHFNPNQSYTLIIKTLLHELTHVKQISRGELKPAPDYKSLMWKGKHAIDVPAYNAMGQKNISAYKKLPWEKEAYSNMDKLYSPFLKSSYWTSLQGKDETLDSIMKNI